MQKIRTLFITVLIFITNFISINSMENDKALHQKSKCLINEVINSNLTDSFKKINDLESMDDELKAKILDMLTRRSKYIIVEDYYCLDKKSYACALSKNNDLAFVAYKKILKIYKISDLTKVNYIKMSHDITAIESSNNSQLIALGLDNGTLCLVKLDTATQICQINELKTAKSSNQLHISVICFSPDDKLAFAGLKNGNVYLISLRDLTNVKSKLFRIQHANSVILATFIYDDALISKDIEDISVLWNIDDSSDLDVKSSQLPKQTFDNYIEDYDQLTLRMQAKINQLNGSVKIYTEIPSIKHKFIDIAFNDNDILISQDKLNNAIMIKSTPDFSIKQCLLILKLNHMCQNNQNCRELLLDKNFREIILSFNRKQQNMLVNKFIKNEDIAIEIKTMLQEARFAQVLDLKSSH